MTIIGNRPLLSSLYEQLLAPDDTEESVTGSDCHLIAINTLYDILDRYAEETGQPWYVTSEVLVLAELPDRRHRPWQSMPDVYVVLGAERGLRSSCDTHTGAPFPQFICEVASESTWQRDIEDKQHLYADLGTLEYIVFDPTPDHALLGQAMRARHWTAAGAWESWLQRSVGFLHSQTLQLLCRPEGSLLRLYDLDGQRQAIEQALKSPPSNS